MEHPIWERGFMWHLIVRYLLFGWLLDGYDLKNFFQNSEDFFLVQRLRSRTAEEKEEISLKHLAPNSS